MVHLPKSGRNVEELPHGVTVEYDYVIRAVPSPTVTSVVLDIAVRNVVVRGPEWQLTSKGPLTSFRKVRP